MNDTMAKVIQLTRADKNALPLVGKTTKLGEEFGEMCEAVLLMEGLIRYKETIGTPLEEGADIIIKTITKPMAYHEPVELIGITPTPGRTVFPEAVFQFDRLIPLYAKIDTIETNSRTYYGVLAIEQVDDCTYRCTIDCYKENNDNSISIHVIH